MEEQLLKESVIRGHHVYKDIWIPVIGQQLCVLSEHNNPHHKRAVAVYKDGVIVGHVPRELSKTFWFFIKHDGKVECEVTGRRKCGKGLEVPCIYKLKGSRSMIEKARQLL